MREEFSFFEQFLEHSQYQSLTRCLCKSTSHDFKEMINSHQKTLKQSYFGVLYKIWKGGRKRVVVVKKYDPVKQNVTGFKSTRMTSFLWSGEPKANKMLIRTLVWFLLKDTFLFFLGYPAFVLLQRSRCMFIFFACPSP